MTILKAEFIANYKAAEVRAQKCSNGITFTVEDRHVLTRQRKELGLSSSDAAHLLAKSGGAYSAHYCRLSYWEAQIRRGVVNMAPLPTGEHIGAGQVVVVPFDGRIKTKADIQPAFNKAAVQLVKLGITNPHDAAAYLANGFQYAKDEQKIDIQASRFVADLRTVGMNKAQAQQAFERAIAQL